MSGPAAMPLAGRRVLVAEDDVLTAMLLEQVLSDLGAEVLQPVVAVAEVIAAADAERPDVVTLDVNLNDEPAYPAAAALRDRGIPFVFLTGYDALPDCPSELRDSPCVRKPVTAADLARALEAAMAGGALGSGGGRAERGRNR